MITVGQYQGQALKDPAPQFGETDDKGTLQLAIALELFNEKNESLGAMTTFLYFTEKSSLRSYEALRALGWTGAGPDDIDKLDGIYKNRVPCQVKPAESYQDPANPNGPRKMGTPKLEITVAGGTVVLNKPLDASSFKSRLKALGGGGGGGSSNSGGPPPPF